MDLEQHINHICKVAFCHRRNLSRIRNCLSLKDTETLVHAFITTKLDNSNSLLAELPQTLIDKLQRVYNAAGRLVSLTCKYLKSHLEGSSVKVAVYISPKSFRREQFESCSADLSRVIYKEAV